MEAWRPRRFMSLFHSLPHRLPASLAAFFSPANPLTPTLPPHTLQAHQHHHIRVQKPIHTVLRTRLLRSFQLPARDFPSDAFGKTHIGNVVHGCLDERVLLAEYMEEGRVREKQRGRGACFLGFWLFAFRWLGFGSARFCLSRRGRRG